VPITTFKLGFLDKLSKKIFEKNNKEKLKIYGDGAGISFSKKRTLIDKFKPAFSMFSLENINSKTLLNKIMTLNRNVITFISHPKLLSNMSFECIEKLADAGHKFETIYGFVKNYECKEKL